MDTLALRTEEGRKITYIRKEMGSLYCDPFISDEVTFSK